MHRRQQQRRQCAAQPRDTHSNGPATTQAHQQLLADTAPHICCQCTRRNAQGSLAGCTAAACPPHRLRDALHAGGLIKRGQCGAIPVKQQVGAHHLVCIRRRHGYPAATAAKTHACACTRASTKWAASPTPRGTRCCMPPNAPLHSCLLLLPLFRQQSLQGAAAAAGSAHAPRAQSGRAMQCAEHSRHCASSAAASPATLQQLFAATLAPCAPRCQT